MKLLFVSVLALSLASCTGSSSDKKTPPPSLGPNAIGNTSGQLIEKLGERQSLCQQPKDQKALLIPSEFQDNVLDLLQKDQWKSFTFKKSQDCLRVGTEVFLQLDQEEKNYMGRAFVTSMIVGEESTQVNFDVMERVYSTLVNQTGQRLPSCRSRGDWKGFIIGKDQVEEKMEKLKNGVFRASIQNGALNCYRVGSKSYVQTHRRDKEKRGFVTPSELRIVHRSELTQTEADLVHMTLDELMQSLEEGKDRDGGFVNIVAFEYTPPEE